MNELTQILESRCANTAYNGHTVNIINIFLNSLLCTDKDEEEAHLKSIIETFALSSEPGIANYYICPGAILRPEAPNHAVYDVDGIEYLLSKYTGEIAPLPVLCEAAQQCCTCMRPCSTDVIESSYVPIPYKDRAALEIKTRLWDQARGREIARKLRSIAACGPTVLSLVAVSNRGGSTVGRMSGPKKVKKRNIKFSGEKLLKSFSFLCSNQATASAAERPRPPQQQQQQVDPDTAIEVDDFQEILCSITKQNDPCVEEVSSAIHKVASAAPDVSPNKLIPAQTALEGIDIWYGDKRYDDEKRTGAAPLLPLTATRGTRSWLDTALNNAARIHDIFEEAFPCSCVAELMARVMYAVRIEIAKRAAGPPVTIPIERFTDEVFSTAIELFTGTLDVGLGIDAAFRKFVASERNIFLSILDAPLRQSPYIASIHAWARAVNLARETLASQRTDVRQCWYLARCDAVGATLPAGMSRPRLHDLANVRGRLGVVVAPASMVMLGPPTTWPCDVCWTRSLAAAGLNLQSPGLTYRLVGEAIVCSGSTRKTLLVVPRTEGLVCGSMICALGGMRRFLPDRPACVLLYPFAAAVMMSDPGVESTVERDLPMTLKRHLQTRLLRAAVAFVSDLALTLLNKITTSIPRFANDCGAVGEELVHDSMTMLCPHEQAGVDALHMVWPVVGLIDSEQPDLELLQGFVCITRPFRKWIITSKKAAAHLGKVPADPDLHTRTMANVRILRTIVDSIQTDRALAQSIVRSLVLASPENDPLCPRARPFIIERTSELAPPYSDKGLLDSETFLIDTTKFDVTDPRLQHLCRLEQQCANNNNISTISAPPSSVGSGIPIAHHVCSSEIITSATHLLVADNPMTLAYSRPVLCPPNGSNFFFLQPLQSPSLSLHPLLPKNSPLLAELMHRRYGLYIAPYARFSAVTQSMASANNAINSVAGALSDEYPRRLVLDLCSSASLKEQLRQHNILNEEDGNEEEELYAREFLERQAAEAGVEERVEELLRAYNNRKR